MISVHSSSSSQKSGTPHTYTYSPEMLPLDTMAKSYIKSPLYNGIEIEVVMKRNGGRVEWMWWWVCCKRKEVTDMKISQQKPQIDNSKPSSVVRQQNEHKEASRERERERINLEYTIRPIIISSSTMSSCSSSTSISHHSYSLC